LIRVNFDDLLSLDAEEVREPVQEVDDLPSTGVHAILVETLPRVGRRTPQVTRAMANLNYLRSLSEKKG